MSVAFAPSLGELAWFLAGRPLEDLWGDPADIARATLDAATRTGASHALFPFDLCVLAEACGIPVRWSNGAPDLGLAPRNIHVADLDPQRVMTAGRVPNALQAAKYVSSTALLAADLPSPSLLMAQLGADHGDVDELGGAEDLCISFARGFLEASASLLVVHTADPGPAGDGDRSLHRLADHFGAMVAIVDADPSVVVLPLAAMASGSFSDIGGLIGPWATVVLTDRPVAPDFDLSLLQTISATMRAHR